MNLCVVLCAIYKKFEEAQTSRKKYRIQDSCVVHTFYYEQSQSPLSSRRRQIEQPTWGTTLNLAANAALTCAAHKPEKCPAAAIPGASQASSIGPSGDGKTGQGN